MNIAYSQIDAKYREAVDHEAGHHIEKLTRLLKSYAPDSAQLHGSFEKSAHRVEFTFLLNLTLPTGSLHATGVGSDVRASLKAAFKEIEAQVKKHQQKLRKDYVWKRKRIRVLKPGEMPIAD